MTDIKHVTLSTGHVYFEVSSKYVDVQGHGVDPWDDEQVAWFKRVYPDMAEEIDRAVTAVRAEVTR